MFGSAVLADPYSLYSFPSQLNTPFQTQPTSAAYRFIYPVRIFRKDTIVVVACQHNPRRGDAETGANIRCPDGRNSKDAKYHPAANGRSTDVGEDQSIGNN